MKRDEYKQLTTDERMAACPVCGARAHLWQYAETPTVPVQRVVMCSHDDRIGPRDGLMNEGCLLYMPPDDFYRATARDAIAYWNAFAEALVALRKRTAKARKHWLEGIEHE